MAAPSEGQPPVTSPPVQVVLSPSNVWRVGFAVAAMVVLVYFLNFVLTAAGSFLLVVVMAGSCRWRWSRRWRVWPRACGAAWPRRW